MGKFDSVKALEQEPAAQIMQKEKAEATTPKRKSKPKTRSGRLQYLDPTGESATVRLPLVVTPAKQQAIKELAALDNVTQNRIMNEALDAYLEERERDLKEARRARRRALEDELRQLEEED